jgi:TolB-like protein/Tfp pilus assembly protein PilF
VAPVVEVEIEGSELILERRTSAVFITEEEEEITDSSRSDAGEPLRRTTPGPQTFADASLIRRLDRRALTVAGVALVALIAYLLTDGYSGRAATKSAVKSIAVLPFRDMGASSGEHLGMGLTDALITRLSDLNEVNVRPTSAVLKFEGKEEDSNAVGRGLGVDAILEGSVYRNQEQVRVTARLVRVSDQSPIWSGQFDERARDLLAVQTAISEQVFDSLALNLSADKREMLNKPYSDSADAYQLYARGRYHWHKRTWSEMANAEFFFRRAIEKDPNFALAYMGLADTLFMGEASPEAYLAVNKAIELDPTFGEAYATRGFANMFHEWNWAEAEANFHRAIELRPGYGPAHQWYATLLAITGRVEEAKKQMRRAVDIDPTSANFLADLGQMHYFAREFEDAELYCRKALDIEPDFIFAHGYLLDIYLNTGRDKEAAEEYVKWMRSNSSDPKYGDQGMAAREAELRALYLQAGMNGLLRHQIGEDARLWSHGGCYQLARLHALLGEKEEALTWLEKSYGNRDFLLPFLNADPVFWELRFQPRYQAIIRRMGLAA